MSVVLLQLYIYISLRLCGNILSYDRLNVRDHNLQALSNNTVVTYQGHKTAQFHRKASPTLQQHKNREHCLLI